MFNELYVYNQGKKGVFLMLNEVEEFLKGDLPDDHWYDDALFLCEDLLKKFSDMEWETLILKLQQYDVKCQIRLAECLGDIGSRYSVEILLMLVQTENRDLLVSCIDALRGTDISLLSSEEKCSLIKTAKKALINCSEIEKKIISSFLEDLKI